MIYLDTSCALASLFNERVQPPNALWDEEICSSELLRYEIFVRLHAEKAPGAILALADELLSKVQLTNIETGALTRALLPFPVAVRTLDTIHLATMDYLRTRGLVVELATYDRRLAGAATAMGFRLVAL